MKNHEQELDWLKRAESNLAQARLGKGSSAILLEDLCFCAQQAAEKALKALCINQDISFPGTHDIGYLLDLLDEKSISVPSDSSDTRDLTQYAKEKIKEKLKTKI
jgi:HEPN domain-containing protein